MNHTMVNQYHIPMEIIGTISYLMIIFAFGCGLAYERVKYVFFIKKKHRRNLVDYETCAALLLSCLFIFVAVVYLMISHGNVKICNYSMVICLLFYVGTKSVLYLLFIEKAFVTNKYRLNYDGPRLKSWFYRVNLLFYSGYVFNFIYCITNNYGVIYDDDGTCVVSIELKGVWFAFSFDMIFSVYMTLLFFKPLYDNYINNKKILERDDEGIQTTIKDINAKIVDLASLCFKGSCVSLISTGSNFIVLGHLIEEPFWMCVSFCATDVTINSCIVHFITKIKTMPSHDSSHTLPNVRSSSLDTASSSNRDVTLLHGKKKLSPLNAMFILRESNYEETLDSTVPNTEEGNSMSQI